MFSLARLIIPLFEGLTAEQAAGVLFVGVLLVWALVNHGRVARRLREHVAIEIQAAAVLYTPFIALMLAAMDRAAKSLGAADAFVRPDRRG